MSRRATGRAALRERGAAAVEMAIIFPLMFLVLAGIVDLGRAFFYQIQLTNAAREAVRAAVVAGDDADPVVARSDAEARAASSATAVTELTTIVLLCGEVPDDPTVAQATSSTPMEWYLLKPAMNLILAGNFPDDFDTLSSTAVMQCGG